MPEKSDPQFRAEYEALEEEYALLEKKLRARQAERLKQAALTNKLDLQIDDASLKHYANMLKLKKVK